MNRPRILIVDDDATHLSSTRGILEAEGYEVHTHDRPFGSTNAILEIRPDLVLLDVNMPALSGEKLAEMYRANAKTRSTRIMLYSSNDEDSLRDARAAVAAGRVYLQGEPRDAALAGGVDIGELEWLVPKISEFLGIVIMINYNEHDPPHFHARYGRQKISVRIADGVVTGKFPTRALSHVLEWWNLHRAELGENWRLARQHMPLKRIEPLE